MPTQIYLPLRSNTNWFGDPTARTKLERQIKLSLLLYDLVVLQNGRLNITAGEDSQGMNFAFPADSYPGDRTKATFYSKGKPFGIEMGGKKLLASTCEVAFDVDFLPILNSAKIADESCFRWSDDELTSEAKGAVEKRANDDLTSGIFNSSLPENRFLRRVVLEGLYRDMVLADTLATPICVDPTVARLVEAQRKLAQVKWHKEVPSIFFEHWLEIDLPDLTTIAWDTVFDFRTSAAGESFREMIFRITKEAKKVLDGGGDDRDLKECVTREFSKELATELAARIQTPGKVFASLCLNLIPFGWVVDCAKDVAALADQDSWISLTRPRNRF